MVTIEDFEKALECCDLGYRGCKECPFGEVCTIEDVLEQALALAMRLKRQRNTVQKQLEAALGEQNEARLERDEALKDRDLAREAADIALAERDKARAELVEARNAAEKAGDSQDDVDRQTKMDALASDLRYAREQIIRLRKKNISILRGNLSLEDCFEKLKEELSRRDEPEPVVWQKAGGSFRCSGCGFMPRFTSIREIRFCPHCGHPAAAYEAAMPEDGTICST